MSKFKLHDFSAADGDVPEEHTSQSNPLAPKKSAPLPDYPPVDHTESVAAGRLPEEVYAKTLPWWRAALRAKCVEVVEWESEVIGKWQVRLPFSLKLSVIHASGCSSSLQDRIRSPWLDTYFLQTSMLGTHTFFLVFLPAFFFFGHDELGRG